MVIYLDYTCLIVVFPNTSDMRFFLPIAYVDSLFIFNKHITLLSDFTQCRGLRL
jgi:hypothetical protein